MKAIRIHHHGSVDELSFEDVPAPELRSPDDVIVQLKAAGVNVADLQFRQGGKAKISCLPRILGADGAGIIAAVGSGVKDLRIGDRICLYPQNGCGQCWACRGDRQEYCEQPQRLGEQIDGTYAEYLRVRRQNCLVPPAGFSVAEAAAIPVAYLSAWRMLITDADLQPGESVLIRGVGESTATAALQLALRLGAHTIVSAEHADNLSPALALGAAHAIDETKEDFPVEVRRLTGKRGVAVVVDCIGGDGWAKSFAALSRGGRLVTCGAGAGAQPDTDLRRIFWHHLKVFGSSLGTRAEFRRVLNFIEATGTKPVIDKVYPLADAAHAHERLAQGRYFGKIILRMND